MKVNRTFRCYPSACQERSLAKTFGCVRVAYNDALTLKEDNYKAGKKLQYKDLSKALTDSKKTKERAYLKDASSVPLQQSLRHLETAYQNFFQKRSARPGYKVKRGRQSAEYTMAAFKFKAGQLSIAKIGRLDVRWSYPLESQPTTVTVLKDASGRYFVTLTLEETKAPLPETGKEVGIDLGINTLAMFSDGTKIENPRWSNTHKEKLAKLQQTLSRRVKGSGRYERLRTKVARLHAHIADSRKDFLNKLTTDIVRKYDVIAIEDLSVKGMLKCHNIARAIADIGMFAFRRMLTYKCLWYGKELRLASRWAPTSKTCNTCGVKYAELKRNERTWTCAHCGTTHDRDLNAAKNILAVGQTVTARGACVKPKRTSVLGRSGRRNVNQPALVSP